MGDVLDHWCSHPDPHILDGTTVSRALIDAQLLARTRDGQWYWRTDSPLVQAIENFTPELLPVADTTEMQIPFKLSPLLVLVRIAIRFKQGKIYTAAEVDALIRQHGKGVEGELAAVRSVLVSEQLLQQQSDEGYMRPLFTSDHPAMGKLRAEALERQSQSPIKIGA